MVPVSRLPDLCLLALFRQMTLQDQIDARKVCRRWADLVPEATSKRRELTLLIGEDSIENFKTDVNFVLFNNCKTLRFLRNADGSLMYPTRRLTDWNSLCSMLLEQSTAEDITTTFRGITKLQVAVDTARQSTLLELAHLLEAWSHQLITFKLSEDCVWVRPTAARFFAAINAQSVLKQLHIFGGRLPVPDLSIISRLEELRFRNDYTSTGEFTQWLQQYGRVNRGLARIDYEAAIVDVGYLDQFTSLSEHLRRGFTRFNFFGDPISDPTPICAHFRSLTSLNIDPYRLNIYHLFSPLATLSQLIHLHLTIYSNTFSDEDLSEDIVQHLLPQVKSVKALELKLTNSMPVHQQLAQLMLPWTLPNIEVIYFEFELFHCTECNIGSFWEPSEEAMFCLFKLFSPLKHDCTKLRLIEHNTESVHGTAEEILAE